MKALFAKFLIVVYSLSVTGYVLLDSLHEAAHVVKSELHQHHAVHDHDHHHVEDHQHVFTPVDKPDVDTKSSVKIFSLLLFYSTPLQYYIPTISDIQKDNGLFEKLITVARAPLTPPPLV